MAWNNARFGPFWSRLMLFGGRHKRSLMGTRLAPTLICLFGRFCPELRFVIRIEIVFPCGTLRRTLQPPL